MTRSTTLVTTDQPALAGRRVVDGLTGHAQASWDDASGTGRAVVDGAATVSMVDVGMGLNVTLTAPDDDIERHETVVGGLLVGDGPGSCTWTRQDGSEGTTQRGTAAGA